MITIPLATARDVGDSVRQLRDGMRRVEGGEGGWINEFGGDSLLAVFGAPVADPDHAARAVRAALGLRRAVATLEVTPPIRIGIGVHTGEMIAGSVGSPDRMEYTVIGDVVNVASRIEGPTKELGADLLVSAEAFEAAGLDLPATPVPPVAVKGKSEPVRLLRL